jgi:hypothetical protein
LPLQVRPPAQVRQRQNSLCHKDAGYHPVNSFFPVHNSSSRHSFTSYHPLRPTMSQPPRQDLIQNAILFLQDPKTQSSPLTSKIEFLQAKGLNESEIQDALSRSSSSSSSVSAYNPTNLGSSGGGGGGYGMRYEMAPVPPKRDWRDLFVCPIYNRLCMDLYDAYG